MGYANELISSNPGFNGHLDTPVESLHVVLLGVVKYLYRHAIKNIPESQHEELRGRWQSFNTSGLNIPPVKPETMVKYAQSLVGKEFRVVLQGAAFVLFPFLDERERHLWTMLGHLSSYIFQTKILDKAQYLEELEVMIDRFINQLILITGQWANKPKFHILMHLVFSIDRFGPASLFATQTQESYNTVTRTKSIMSNHLAPGFDIGSAYGDDAFMRLTLSGSEFSDTTIPRKKKMRAAPKVRALFEIPLIQAGLGWNSKWNDPVEVSAKREYFV